MMDKFVGPKRKEQDRIEAYLDKVLASVEIDAVKSADRFQAQLGIPVAPEDVDLIYTCEALAAEMWTNDRKRPKGSYYRYNTQCFRDVVSEMRLDTERELNDAIYKLQATGVSHEEAVIRTLRRVVDPSTLRKEANQVGYTTCMERSGPVMKRKGAVLVRALVIATALISFVGLMFCASQVQLHTYRSIGTGIYLCVLFLTIVGFTYSVNIRQIDPMLQTQIDKFVTRRHFSNVSTMQRIRWMAFRNRYPSSDNPSTSMIVLELAMALFIVFLSMTRVHFAAGFVGVFGYLTTVHLGRRFWAGRDHPSKPFRN